MFQSTAIAPDLYAASFTALRWAAHSVTDGSALASPSRRPARLRPSRGRVARLALTGFGAVAVAAVASVIVPASDRSVETSRSYQCMATSCDPTYPLKESAGSADDVALGAPVTVAVPASVSKVPCISTGACNHGVLSGHTTRLLGGNRAS